jgi:light-regulated signal transduction histidine kinase (bacteriophytochrome)
MKRLIEDLLNFSRVTTKEAPRERLSLRETVLDVLQDLETRIAQTKARIDVGDLPFVDADPMQMRQLFQNLIANSIKFAKNGDPAKIRIHGRPEDGRVRVYVEDEGIGFDEKYLDRIFKPFQRLHGREEYEGTGIGLAICQKIVQRHGGTITASSRPGEGATFCFTLPAA